MRKRRFRAAAVQTLARKLQEAVQPMNVAVHAPDAVPIDARTLREVPPDALARSAMRLDPSLTLLASPWPVGAISQTDRQGDVTRPHECSSCLYRGGDLDSATILSCEAADIKLLFENRTFQRLWPRQTAGHF